MDDRPYTTPEEDPFNVRHVVQLYPRPRKSSLLDKWIQEQKRYMDTPALDARSHMRSHSSPLVNAYVAYPDITHASLDRPGTAEGLAMPTFDLVHGHDIPQCLAAQFASLKVTDAPPTIRSSKHTPRMSFTPSSFRHFNLVFRSPASQADVTDNRPSSRLSLFSRPSRNSGGTVTGRGTITPQSTPQKHLTRVSPNSHRPPSPRKSPAKIRPRAPSTRWRPTVLGHFDPVEPITPAASQTSIQPPPSDSTYSPSRPSLSSSADVSHAHTSLTVPSIESSSVLHYSPTSSEQKQSPPKNIRPQTSAHSPQHSAWSSCKSDAKRYSTPPIGPVPPQPQFHQQHNRGLSSFASPAAASSVSSLRSAYPSSVNTNSHIHDVFTTPAVGDRELASPSPTPSSSTSPSGARITTAPRGSSPYGMTGAYPRMYPFVYQNSAQSQPASVSSRRGANAFDGIPSAWRYLYTPGVPGASVPGFEYGIDDTDDEFASGSTCSYTFSASQAHSPAHPHHVQQQHGHQEKKKKKADVVYASAASQGGGGTLSKMTSFSNLALAPMTMRSKKKKKRLIVSGVALNDTKKFEGVKRWCESFGEVRQILRMPNGDLVISFQSAEVADTVCRVRAKVFINGVGSVQLSWTTEKKR